MKYLKNNKSHPTIVDIHRAVSKQLSTISMTTVYNTMDILKKNGLVMELPVLSGEGRKFDSNTVPHDHLICRYCGTTFDINCGIDHSVLLNEDQKQGFDIMGIFTCIYGLCPECKNTENKTSVG